MRIYFLKPVSSQRWKAENECVPLVHSDQEHVLLYVLQNGREEMCSVKSKGSDVVKIHNAEGAMEAVQKEDCQCLGGRSNQQINYMKGAYDSGSCSCRQGCPSNQQWG